MLNVADPEEQGSDKLGKHRNEWAVSRYGAAPPYACLSETQWLAGPRFNIGASDRYCADH